MCSGTTCACDNSRIFDAIVVMSACIRLLAPCIILTSTLVTASKQNLARQHGRRLAAAATPSSKLMPVLRDLQTTLNRVHSQLAGLCESNLYTLEYLCSSGQPAADDDAEADALQANAAVQEAAVARNKGGLGTQQTDAKKHQNKKNKKAGSV